LQYFNFPQPVFQIKPAVFFAIYGKMLFFENEKIVLSITSERFYAYNINVREIGTHFDVDCIKV